MTLAAHFAIGGREVGGAHSPYVIAEVGANHDRDRETASAYVRLAVATGCDAVKFQTYDGHRIYSRRTPRFAYLASITDKSPADLLDEISLPRPWQAELAREAVAAGIHFFSSPFDHEAVAELDALDVPVLKIASFEIVDLPLIKRAAATGRPLLISTGMASLGDIEDALRAVEDEGGTQVGLMQCTSAYPAPPELANLAAMETMRRAFGVPVGLSDHTQGMVVPIAATAMGAAFLEKHVTLSRARTGPDHPFAIEPPELATMVRSIREAHAAIGDGRKSGPSELERQEMYSLGRRSLIAARDLPAGTVLEAEMLTVKRPGFGVPPKMIDVVVGMRVTSDVEEDDVLIWDMLR